MSVPRTLVVFYVGRRSLIFSRAGFHVETGPVWTVGWSLEHWDKPVLPAAANRNPVALSEWVSGLPKEPG